MISHFQKVNRSFLAVFRYEKNDNFLVVVANFLAPGANYIIILCLYFVGGINNNYKTLERRIYGIIIL